LPTGGHFDQDRNYQLSTALDAPYAKTAAIASIPTRLKALDASSQEKLMNWGYAVCDAAIRIPAPASPEYARTALTTLTGEVSGR
jgi:hypothetical protein